jgi:hypothetical protein
MTAPAPSHLTIAVGRLNPVVGDLDNNAEKGRQTHAKAAPSGLCLTVCGLRGRSGIMQKTGFVKS